MRKKGYTIVEYLIICGLITLMVVCSPFGVGIAQEFQSRINESFNFSAPIINSSSNNTFAANANNTPFWVNNNDNRTWVASTYNLSKETNFNSYTWSLSAAEMNHNKTNVGYNGTGCLEQFFVINTAPYEKSAAIYTGLGNGTVVSASVTGNVGGNITGSVLGTANLNGTLSS